MASDDVLPAVRKTRKLMQTLRNSVGPDVSATLLQTFALVAEYEGKSVAEIAEMMGGSYSSVSRNLLDLSDTLRNGSTGFKLLTRFQQPDDLRTVYYKLSPKGRGILNAIRDVLED